MPAPEFEAQSQHFHAGASSRLTTNHTAFRAIQRSLKRWILPVAVFGSSATNSSQRGYL
jgi:hypothetical protein